MICSTELGKTTVPHGTTPSPGPTLRFLCGFHKPCIILIQKINGEYKQWGLLEAKIAVTMHTQSTTAAFANSSGVVVRRHLFYLKQSTELWIRLSDHCERTAAKRKLGLLTKICREAEKCVLHESGKRLATGQKQHTGGIP